MSKLENSIKTHSILCLVAGCQYLVSDGGSADCWLAGADIQPGAGDHGPGGDLYINNPVHGTLLYLVSDGGSAECWLAGEDTTW